MIASCGLAVASYELVVNKRGCIYFLFFFLALINNYYYGEILQRP